VLQRGDALIWFPEAWRSPTGALQPFLPGIGSLVERSGATALPAYIDGAFEAMPRWARLPRLRPIAVRFGVALAPAQLAQARLAGEEGATAAERITRSLERRVAALARRG
jgi:long-chain acyl-CoA synthetase